MEYVYVGKICGTHGLNGEVKIKSDFLYKNKVFVKDFVFYVGDEKIKLVVSNYRPHNSFDLVCFYDICDISLALKYKNCSLYINHDDVVLSSNEFVDEDYIGCDGYYNDKCYGKIVDIIDSGSGNLLFVFDNGKYVPKNNNFIVRVDVSNKKIYFKNVEGLL